MNVQANREIDRSPAPPRGDGVDVSLIRWMLSLTPAERLDALQRNARAIIELRRARRRP
jgi:hypothetical protein